jgi:hypothetical protein
MSHLICDICYVLVVMFIVPVLSSFAGLVVCCPTTDLPLRGPRFGFLIVTIQTDHERTWVRNVESFSFLPPNFLERTVLGFEFC